MKKNILLLVLLVVHLFSGCTDLTEEMFSSIGSSSFYKKNDHILQSVSSAYVYMANAHTYDTKNEELTADQILTPTRGIHGYNDGEYVRYITHNWTYLDDGVSAPWGRYFSVVASANNSINDLESLTYEDIGGSNEDKLRNLNELRTLRAWAYLRLLDMYGGVPIITDIFDEEFPIRNTAKETYDFIEKELNESLTNLPVKINNGEQDKIYRMTKAANRLIMIRLYMNSEAYIGENKFSEAKSLCEDIINGKYGDYELDEKWNGPFTWDNINSPEIIFSFSNEKGQRDMQDWWYGGYHHYNSHLTFGCSYGSKGWNGWGLAPSITALGEPLNYKLGMPFSRYNDKDVRKKQWHYLGGGEYEGMFLYGLQLTFDGKDTVRGTEEYNGLPLIFVDYCARLSEGDYTSNSLLNGEENTNIRPVKICPLFPDIDADLQSQADVPAMRLAEVYFSLAECNLRLGDKDKAAQYINNVIKRNYNLIDWEEDDSLHVSAMDLDDDGYRMLEEWGKEFITEHRRRSDLIRWNKFTTEIWFNHDKPTDPTKRIFPIPHSAINGNPLLEQNPGY